MNLSTKMNTYTLLELVDLALATPEKGGVNFNVLSLLLKSLLKKSRLSKHAVRYKAVDAETLMKKILEEKGEISLSNDEEIDEGLEKMDEKIDEKESTESEEGEEAEKGSKKRRRQILSVPELQDMFTSVKSLQERFGKVQQKLESLEKVIKRTKKDIEKKAEQEDAYKSDQEEKLGLNKEQLDETIDEIKDSIARLGNRLIEQEKLLRGPAHVEAINKLCEKVAEREIEKKQGDFNDRLKSLGATVLVLQKFIKEYLYPGAAGVTKCVTCGRTAHLPNLDLLSAKPGDTRADKKLEEFVTKRTFMKKESQKKHELKFTLLSLDNIKKDGRLAASKFLQQDQELPCTLVPVIESQDNGKIEKRPDNVFNTAEATSAFMPLRLIPDPARSGPLLADAIHLNPDVLSVSVIGSRKPLTMRFQAKPTMEENA